MRCKGVTYVSGWSDEDGARESVAQCDAGPPGDCGFEEPFPDYWDIGITSEEMDAIHARHIAHSKEAK